MVRKSGFLDNTKEVKLIFFEKDFAGKILKHSGKIENLKPYKMAYLVFQYFNIAAQNTQ